MVPEYGSHWPLMWTHPEQGIGARVRKTRACTWAQKWVPGSCIHAFFVCPGAVYCFVLVAKIMFQNGLWQSENAWNNYVESYAVRALKV